jgi:DNA helicase-2/ATP-dependent DNA helicase PcrA
MDQQIFGFNGSSPTLESAFREHYRDAISVRLDYNYRSPRNYVALADAFIQATEKREETVPPNAVQPDGKPLRIVERETDEAALLVDLVTDLQDRGVGAPPACERCTNAADGRVRLRVLQALKTCSSWRA